VPDSLNCVKESTYPVRYLSRKTLKAFAASSSKLPAAFEPRVALATAAHQPEALVTDGQQRPQTVH
jgi:hypothetical protein